MNFNLKKPCDNCPFRTDIDFPLRKDRRVEIDQALRNDATFQCHKTINTESKSHCAGALLVMRNEGILHHSQMIRIAQRLGLFNSNDLVDDGIVFDDLHEFEGALDHGPSAPLPTIRAAQITKENKIETNSRKHNISSTSHP